EGRQPEAHSPGRADRAVVEGRVPQRRGLIDHALTQQIKWQSQGSLTLQSTQSNSSGLHCSMGVESGSTFSASARHIKAPGSDCSASATELAAPATLNEAGANTVIAANTKPMSFTRTSFRISWICCG